MRWPIQLEGLEQSFWLCRMVRVLAPRRTVRGQSGGHDLRGVSKITDGRRSFSEVDNHDAVKIGELVKNSEAINLVRRNFSYEFFLNAFVREGVDELTHRVCQAIGVRSCCLY